MQQWEYDALSVANFQPAAIADSLDELGLEGWELVTIYQNIAYFKRPKTIANQKQDAANKNDAANEQED